jgi:ABC-type Zn2+ transport system substrate-binding protein/surface adhesin
MTKKHLTIAILAAGLTLAPLHAADQHEHGDKKHDHEEKKVDVTVPEGADALWAEIDVKRRALNDVVASKKMEGLHVAAESVKILAAAVPAKYADLAPDKRKRVEGQAKNVARVLDELHEEGEEGHWDSVTKKMAQLDAALKIMKEQTSGVK